LQKNIFISLFETYQLPLYRYLLQMTRNEETAEELLQETFYRAMVSLKVENMNQAKAWLFKVARNLYIDQLRKAEAEGRMLEKVKAKQTGISSLGNPQQQLEKNGNKKNWNKFYPCFRNECGRFSICGKSKDLPIKSWKS
jgi:RNA polymerase sigma factor (sigma-70 family)